MYKDILSGIAWAVIVTAAIAAVFGFGWLLDVLINRYEHQAATLTSAAGITVAMLLPLGLIGRGFWAGDAERALGFNIGLGVIAGTGLVMWSSLSINVLIGLVLCYAVAVTSAYAIHCARRRNFHRQRHPAGY